MIDLKAIRKARGITQQQLADEAHCVRTAIANIECGIAQPSVTLAKALAKPLGIEWWKFFEEDDDDGAYALHCTGSRETPEN
jgi:transcriptional regulator with XRE-family HTH domain